MSSPSNRHQTPHAIPPRSRRARCTSFPVPSQVPHPAHKTPPPAPRRASSTPRKTPAPAHGSLFRRYPRRNPPPSQEQMTALAPVTRKANPASSMPPLDKRIVQNITTRNTPRKEPDRI